MIMRALLPLLLSPLLATAAMAQAAHEAPANAPSRITIADSAEPGTRLTVSGRVVDAEGRPVPEASIYVYHTDQKGEYVRGTSGGSDRPRLFGYLRSDAQGRYAFSTIRPGSYPNSRNPGHVHFEIVAPGHRQRIYEIVFAGDPLIPDQFRQQARLPYGGVAIVEAREVGGGLVVEHDIRVQ
jgi:protocatechuate 3,4-dioxygenase beta subunit